MFRFHVRIAGLSGEGLTVRFDSALEKLSRLVRLFIEPDGSFVWRRTEADGTAWQVDGNLVDRGDVLACVGLKGHCPERQFDEVLGALGWPEAELSFELPRQGVVLDEAEFRRQAASADGAF